MIWQVIPEKTFNNLLEMCQKCPNSYCLDQKKVNKRDSDLKKKEKEKNKLFPNRFGNWFRKQTRICAKTAKSVTFWTKKMKQNNSEYKNSSLVGQINCKNTKKKSKLLVKCFVNSFRKDPQISARNVPKRPEMSLFEHRKKSNKRIGISKLALQ